MDNPETLLEQLKSLNYFKFVPPTEINSALNNALTSLKGGSYLSFDCDLYDERKVLLSRDRRKMGVDGEDLAEGEIEKTLRNLEEMLKIENVSVGEITQDIGNGNGYSITINGTLYPVYGEEDIKTKNTWLMSVTTLMKIVNDLLSTANSEERLYATIPANDGAIYLLTPKIYEFYINLNINTKDNAQKPISYEEMAKKPTII